MNFCVGVRVLVVCFLYKTNPNPRKGILLWEKVAQMPLFKPNFCCCCCCSHINSWLQCSPRLGLGWHWVGEFVGFMITFYKMWKKTVSCEIEDFVETHVCKLRGILRSRVLRVLCDLIKNVTGSPYWGGQNRTKSDTCGTQWAYKYVAVDMYAILFTFVGRNLINSSMRGKKIPYNTRWIGQTITRNRTKYMSVPSSTNAAFQLFYLQSSFVYLIQFWSTYMVGGGRGILST